MRGGAFFIAGNFIIYCCLPEEKKLKEFAKSEMVYEQSHVLSHTFSSFKTNSFLASLNFERIVNLVIPPFNIYKNDMVIPPYGNQTNLSMLYQS